MDKPTKTKSYRAIVATAKILFKKHGIKKVTVEEICEEAGVSKMTFYRFFENKINLTEQVLRDIHENEIDQYRTIMRKNINFDKKIEQVILLRHSTSHGISNEFLKDVYKNTNKRLKKLIDLQNKIGIAEFMKDVENEQKKGQLRKDLKPELILYMIGKLTESLTDKDLLELYNTPQEAVTAITEYFFKGIGGKLENT